MNLEERDVKKLEVIFNAKYDAMNHAKSPQNTSNRGFWFDYCKRHNIEMIQCRVDRWMCKDLDVICISSPENDFWLLVPKNMAEKVIVLGYLP